MKKNSSFTEADRKEARLAVHRKKLGCLLSSLSIGVFMFIGFFAAKLPQGHSGATALVFGLVVIISGLIGLPLWFFSMGRVATYKGRFGKSVFDDEPTPARVAVKPAVEHESHTWSPWTMKSVPLYYSGHFRCVAVGQRTCLVCGETDICREHEWSEHDRVGSPQRDYTVNYRCRQCGAEHSVEYNI
jgi:hypothetical protein